MTKTAKPFALPGKHDGDELHKLPMWASRHIQKLHRSATGRGAHSGEWALDVVARHHGLGHLIDHWGRNGKTLYTEPYTNWRRAAPDAERLAVLLECEWRFAPSAWFPPRTIRIEFYRLDDDRKSP